MTVYINKERRSDEGSSYVQKCIDKAEKYEAYKKMFEPWAKDNGKSEEEIAAGVQALDDLIEFWRERAELGEV